MFRNLYDQMVLIAASVEATEMAVFSAGAGVAGPELKNVLHVRPDDASDEQRQEVVAAFRDIARQFVARGEDGAIRVSEASDASGRQQFCLVALTRRANDVVGAAAFMVRRKDLDEARAALASVKGAGT